MARRSGTPPTSTAGSSGAATPYTAARPTGAKRRTSLRKKSKPRLSGPSISGLETEAHCWQTSERSSRLMAGRMGWGSFFQPPFYSLNGNAPFVPTLLVEWRKRINVSFVIKVNDALCDAMPKVRRNKKSFGLNSRGTLVATQVCDATVAPQNIRFPQDTSLLNEARTKLEKMIDWFCSQYGLKKPRMYPDQWPTTW